MKEYLLDLDTNNEAPFISDDQQNVTMAIVLCRHDYPFIMKWTKVGVNQFVLYSHYPFDLVECAVREHVKQGVNYTIKVVEQK